MGSALSKYNDQISSFCSSYLSSFLTTMASKDNADYNKLCSKGSERVNLVSARWPSKDNTDHSIAMF